MFWLSFIIEKGPIFFFESLKLNILQIRLLERDHSVLASEVW